MRLVRNDLVARAVKEAHAAIDWPQYSIFVYLRCYDSVVIAPRTFLHGDLFAMLKQDWKHLGHAAITIRETDVFDGHIEWEDDGSFRILTERGERLPNDLESQLIAILQRQE